MRTTIRRIALLAALGMLCQFATCTAIVGDSLINGFINATTNVLIAPFQQAGQDVRQDAEP